MSLFHPTFAAPPDGLTLEVGPDGKLRITSRVFEGRVILGSALSDYFKLGLYNPGTKFLVKGAPVALADIPASSLVSLLELPRTMSYFGPGAPWGFRTDDGMIALFFSNTVASWTPTDGLFTDDTNFVDVRFRSRMRQAATTGEASSPVQAVRGQVTNPHQNMYYQWFLTYAAGTAAEPHRHFLSKVVAGTQTDLAVESRPENWVGLIFDCILQAQGATIKSSRDGGVTFPNIATDTSFASGRLGYPMIRIYGTNPFMRPISIGPPASPAPKPLAYLEVDVVQDPETGAFRPDLPKTVSWSAVIKTGRDGKPVDYRSIVRIFSPMDLTGYRKLTREEAIARVKVLDDLLTDFDLLTIPKPTKAQIAECKQERRSKYGIDLDDEHAIRVLQDDKGW